MPMLNSIMYICSCIIGVRGAPELSRRTTGGAALEAPELNRRTGGGMVEEEAAAAAGGAVHRAGGSGSDRGEGALAESAVNELL